MILNHYIFKKSVFDGQAQCHIPLIWTLGRQRQKYVLKFKSSLVNSDSRQDRVNMLKEMKKTTPGAVNGEVSESAFGAVCQFVSVHL